MKFYLIIPLLLLLLLASCTNKEQQGTNDEKSTETSDLVNQNETADTIYCYIKSIVKNDSGFTMKYDPIVFLMGDDAVALIKKEHPEIKSEEEFSLMMLNDYYISNNDTTQYTGYYLSDIPIKMQTFSFEADGSLKPNLQISSSVFFKALTVDQNWRLDVPYIITRKKAEITSITEQFIP